jgi:hypothetical protein
MAAQTQTGVEVLASALAISVSDIQASSVGGDVQGFASQAFCATVTSADGKSKHLFVKRVLGDGVRSENMRVPFEHEVNFYASPAIAGHIRRAGTSIRIPTCDHASLQLIVLEDLVKSRDGAVGDQLKGCTYEAAEGVIRALADMHALFWKKNEVLSTPSLGRFSLATGICANPQVRNRVPHMVSEWHVGIISSCNVMWM